jgi:hypothetical protein
MEWLSSISTSVNAWIVAHKELLAVVGIPLISWFVTNIAARTSEQRSSAERQMERRLRTELKLIEFRQRWIDELRSELSSFVGHITTAKEDSLDQQAGIESLAKIQLLMNPKDPDYDELTIKMRKLIRTMTADQAGGQEALELLKISQTILKREWDRLKLDVAEVEANR